MITGGAMNKISVVIRNDIDHKDIENIILFIIYERAGIEITREVIESILYENLRVLGISGIKDLFSNYSDDASFEKKYERAIKLSKIFFPELYQHESNTSVYFSQIA